MWFVCFFFLFLFFNPHFCIHIFFLIIYDQRRATASFLVMHISHAFFACPTSFPHITFVYCNFNTQYACEFLQTGRTILALNNRDIDLTSQVGRISMCVCVWGGYDTVPHNTRTPLQIIKKPDICRKCTRHLRSRYARSFLTFYTRHSHQETETF